MIRCYCLFSYLDLYLHVSSYQLDCKLIIGSELILCFFSSGLQPPLHIFLQLLQVYRKGLSTNKPLINTLFNTMKYIIKYRTIMYLNLTHFLISASKFWYINNFREEKEFKHKLRFPRSYSAFTSYFKNFISKKHITSLAVNVQLRVLKVSLNTFNIFPHKERNTRLLWTSWKEQIAVVFKP